MQEIGLCSVTFRDKSVEEVIGIAKECGLDSIEWGGDTHVPPDDPEAAKWVGELTRKAGLEVSSYGSYYFARQDTNFDAILETARQLGTKDIRIWAGKAGSDELDEAGFQEIVEETKENAQKAGQQDMRLHFEFHRGTYTDTPDSARRLAEAVDEPNVFLYWQPKEEYSTEQQLDAIKRISPWMQTVHVFYWEHFKNRFSLEEGKDSWKQYIETINQTVPGDKKYLFEFVKDDSPEQLMKDSQVLKGLLGK